MKKSRKKSGFAFTIGAALLIGAASFVSAPHHAVAGAGLQRPAQPVIAARVKTDRFVDRVEALGTLRANETVTLTATVTEIVTDINFEDGQRVKKGDVLVEMTQGEEAAELDAAQFTMDEAQKQMERLMPLVKSGAASQSLLDAQQRDYETARARLNAVKARLSDRLIVAPFDGIVGLRHISVGTALSPGMAIVTLDDDSVMKLDFAVPAIFLTSLQPGLEIIVHAAPFGERAFHGTIASVDSQIDAVTRSITARALIENDERMLKPGLLMNVALLKNPRDALVIPEEAIIPQGTRSYVFIVEDDNGAPIARRREITTGARRPGEVEVISGLQSGDLIVTHGTLNIRDNAPVTIRAEQDGTTDIPALLREDHAPERDQPGKVN